jgi:hypothetical protein
MRKKRETSGTASYKTDDDVVNPIVFVSMLKSKKSSKRA